MSHAVACAVIQTAFEEGVGTTLDKKSISGRNSLEAFVRKEMYYPAYVPLVDPSQVQDIIYNMCSV